MSDRFIERPREVRACKITEDNAADVATWCGDNAMALPNGSVLYYVGEVPNIAPVDHYIVRADGRLSHTTADDFERQWAPAESE